MKQRMNFRTMGLLSTKLRNQAFKLFKFIENNGNPDSRRNGEIGFLRAFLNTKSLEDRLTILDCGANRGEWTASFLKLAERRPRRIGPRRYSPLMENFMYSNYVAIPRATAGLYDSKTHPVAEGTT